MAQKKNMAVKKSGRRNLLQRANKAIRPSQRKMKKKM